MSVCSHSIQSHIVGKVYVHTYCGSGISWFNEEHKYHTAENTKSSYRVREKKSSVLRLLISSK